MTIKYLDIFPFKFSAHSFLELLAPVEFFSSRNETRETESGEKTRISRISVWLSLTIILEKWMSIQHAVQMQMPERIYVKEIIENRYRNQMTYYSTITTLRD